MVNDLPETTNEIIAKLEALDAAFERLATIENLLKRIDRPAPQITLSAFVLTPISPWGPESPGLLAMVDDRTYSGSEPGVSRLRPGPGAPP